jgi:hypothetical protein
LGWADDPLGWIERIVPGKTFYLPQNFSGGGNFGQFDSSRQTPLVGQEIGQGVFLSAKLETRRLGDL